MRLFSLDNRLALCASFVRKGATVADIGTDHAYLPIWLVKTGVIKKALACDINEGPLNSGKADIQKYELSDCITLRLSDGLLNVEQSECEDIVIAGMGGELIAKILDDCKWSKSKDKHYILQPMTKAEVLVEYLFENGFDIIKQKACTSDKKHYTVILARYVGTKVSYDKSQLFMGRLDPNDEQSKLYLSHVVSHLQKRSISDKSLNPIIKKIKGATKL